MPSPGKIGRLLRGRKYTGVAVSGTFSSAAANLGTSSSLISPSCVDLHIGRPTESSSMDLTLDSLTFDNLLSACVVAWRNIST